MIDADVSLYLISSARIARLKKTVSFVTLPRLREFVKLRNREQWDSYAFTVTQVTHCEGGAVEVCLNMTNFVDGQSVVSFFEDRVLDEYVSEYQREGWLLASVVPNKVFRDDGKSVWSGQSELESLR